MAVDAFIKFTGNRIQVAGESQDTSLSGKAGWSAIRSVTFSTEHPASIGTSSTGAGGGKVQFNDFTITKFVDIASPSLFLALCSGDTFKEVDIVVRKAVGGTEASGTLGYLQYSFYLVFVTKIDLALNDGDEAPTETITFAYGATPDLLSAAKAGRHHVGFTQNPAVVADQQQGRHERRCDLLGRPSPETRSAGGLLRHPSAGPAVYGPFGGTQGRASRRGVSRGQGGGTPGAFRRRHRSVLFQLYCLQGNLDGVQTQLQLVGDFDVEATLWVGVCEKLLACETSRRQSSAGRLRRRSSANRRSGSVARSRHCASVSRATGRPRPPARPMHWPRPRPWRPRSTVRRSSGVADADSRLGPLLEAYIDGKYYWIPFEHIREINPRGRTHFMDSIWAPADFLWLNEGAASGYLPVRYPGSETNANPQIQLGRATDWQERAEGFFCGLGHRIFATNDADFSVGEIRTMHFAQPGPTFGATALDPASTEAVEPADPRAEQ